MAKPILPGIPSRAAIMGHPLHPMLIPFPIAFLTGAFVTDLAFFFNADAFWARASFWLLAAGFLMGIVAALFGLIDFLLTPYIRSFWGAWVHMIGNDIILVMAAFNLVFRLEGQSSVPSLGIVLSGLSALGLFISGGIGGNLVFKHKIGVQDPTVSD